MSVLLDQSKNYGAEFGSVFRSSAIFYIPKSVDTTVTVSNYWDFKNGLEVGLLFSIRDLSGKLIERRERYSSEGLVINESSWPVAEGSVEVEAFGNKNLRIPYAAVMGIYETTSSITMVHSYGRNHNLIELEDGNYLTQGFESCWTIRHNVGVENKAVFHNGHSAVDQQVATFTLTNVEGQDKTIDFVMPALNPFETYVFDVSTIVSDYKEWLDGSDGWGTVHFNNKTSFTRLLLIWENKTSQEVQVTHSNFDYSHVDTNMIEATKPALMKWPSIVSNSKFGKIIVYPKFSKGRYKISSSENIDETETGLFINAFNKKFLEFTVTDNNAIPSRIVTGFSSRKNNNDMPFECSMGVVHEKRPPKRFHWAVVSKKFQSQLFFNSFPEIYDVPENIFLVFRLYSATALDYLEKRVEILSINDIPDGIGVDELFGEDKLLDSSAYSYVSMFSNFGGWMMYSTMQKNSSMTIEHSF